jgi:hypothetical protein
METRWTIDVCATCGALATYPFTCGHRTTDRPWTYVVVVKPAYPRRYEKLFARSGFVEGDE